MADLVQAPPKIVKVRLATPSTLPSQYATNFSVQGTDHEFIITFFEARPPLIAGSPAEQEEQWARVSEVEAVPLARVIVAATRMPELLQVLQDSFAKSPGNKVEVD